MLLIGTDLAENESIFAKNLRKTLAKLAKFSPSSRAGAICGIRRTYHWITKEETSGQQGVQGENYGVEQGADLRWHQYLSPVPSSRSPQ